MNQLFRICILLITLIIQLKYEALAQWSTDTLSQARYNITPVSAGSKALFAGGYFIVPPGFDRASDVVDVYDASTSKWSTAQLSQARHTIAATRVGDIAILAGGQTGLSYAATRVSSAVDLYNVTTNTWSTTVLSQARSRINVVNTPGKAFFIGGVLDFYYLSDIIDIYDGATRQWSATRLPSYTANLAVAAGEKLILMGNPSQIYDPATGQFTSTTAVTVRTNMTLANADTKALFAGGVVSGSVTAQVEIYNATSNQWTSAQLAQARAGMAAARLGNFVFLGGGSSAAGASDVVDIYNGATNQFSSGRLSQARTSIVTATAGTYVFFAGGFANDMPSNVVDIYNTVTNQWTSTRLPNLTGDGLRVTAVGNRVLFVADNSKLVDVYTIAPVNQPLTLLAPTYDCQSGAFKFNTSGGDGSPIEFSAVAITGWTTNPNQFVDKETRTAADAQPVTLRARQNGREVTYIWDIRAQCPVVPAGTFQIITPLYDCQTGAFTFRTSGGNGSPVEYAAIGITGWTTNPNQFVDVGLRTANDVNPLTLQARQNGVAVTYSWDLMATCGRVRNTSSEQTELLMTVSSNPTSGQFSVDIVGGTGETLTLQLTDSRGRLITSRIIEQAKTVEHQTFDVRQQATGMLVLQAVGKGKAVSIKILKQ